MCRFLFSSCVNPVLSCTRILASKPKGPCMATDNTLTTTTTTRACAHATHTHNDTKLAFSIRILYLFMFECC